MKKFLIHITIILITLIFIPVNAANYELKELIPINTKTTIVTDHFSYKNFYFNESIFFENIKNISKEELPISISIGLFDEKKENIGIINYCSKNDQTLKSEEEINFLIEVNNEYLASNKSINDIKYISILNENINCRTGGSLEFVGKKVEEIKVTKNSLLENKNTKLVIYIFSFLIVLIIIMFLYKFIFTNSFNNFNGEDVRKEFAYKNKQLAKERENKHKEIIKSKPKSKSTEVLEQEKIENANENQEKTDLHNMYK